MANEYARAKFTQLSLKSQSSQNKVANKMLDDANHSIFRDHISLSSNSICAWKDDHLYNFGFDPNDLDVVMRVVVNHIYPLIFEDFSASYVIGICEFLNDEQKEFYQLKYA